MSTPAFQGILGAVATISKRAADRLKAGHVWIYRSEIAALDPENPVPGLLHVQDAAGRPLGTALWSPTSQIALRMVSPLALDEAAWLALVRRRLAAALLRREELLDEGTDSCRLVFSEADQLPGLVVDKYADLAIFQLLAAALDTPAMRQAVTEELVAALGGELTAVLERPDPRIRELEALPLPSPDPLWSRPSIDGAPSSTTETVFRLNGLRFHYDAGSGQKTGAFLDQRLNYRLAAARGHGDALDVCCYQGGFALHLATTCRTVRGLDTSAAALEVAQRNLQLNQEAVGGIEVDWVRGDAFAALREWADGGEAFDTIVLDPPAFAKSQRAAESALRGYKELNRQALRMLRPGGTLLTCSCSHHVRLGDFQAAVAAAAADAGCRVRLLERTGAAPDHPVVLSLPETEYLKCLVLEVDETS